MTDRWSELETVEKALLELDAAEKARLFQRTRLDAPQLLVGAARQGSPGWRRTARRVLGSAAAIAVMVLAWHWIYVERPGGPRLATAPVGAYDGGDGSFYKCFGGPSEAVVTDCRAHDYDADGDVDLADFRAFELAFADASCVGKFEAR